MIKIGIAIIYAVIIIIHPSQIIIINNNIELFELLF